MVVAIRKDVLNIDNMSTQKKLKQAIKKVPKTKEELKSDIARNIKVEHIKNTIRKIYPVIEKTDSIYDGQTVVNALGGFIMAHIENESAKFKLSDLPIDLSKEDDSKIKTAIEEIMKLMKDEPAKELASTLERLGKTMGDFSAHEFLKNKMEELPLNKILA